MICRMRALLTLALGVLIGASVSGQEPPQSPPKLASDLPVMATLRFEGGRTSFKVGEPIRFELVFTASVEGFMAESGGTDDAAETLTISPHSAVRRLPPKRGRDVYSYHGDITQTTNVFPMCANYWALFDRPGSYTISLETRRVAPSKLGNLPVEPALVLKTNALTFTIEPTSSEDELKLIATADQALRASLTASYRDQMHAAEMLAFLPSDAAAPAKYRWYLELLNAKDMQVYVRELLRRGFGMTRNPAAVLAAIEWDLQDLNHPVTSDMISNASAIAVAVNRPDYREGERSWTLEEKSHPYFAEQARYLAMVHESLAVRSGQSKLLSAAAMLSILGVRTPPDVVQMLMAGFAELPLSTRVSIVATHWETIRSRSLVPMLRRMLDDVEPGSRSYVLPALIEIAPSLAVEPLSADILHPTLLVEPNLVAKMPRGSMSHLAAPLLAWIWKQLDAPKREYFRIENKLRLLAVVDDGSMSREVRELYDTQKPLLNPITQSHLLHYLLEWSPAEGKQRMAAAADTHDRYMLYAVNELGRVPALAEMLRYDLFDQDLQIASRAASLLSRHAQADDLAAVDQRLTQWRVAAQRRLGLAEPLTQSDGNFEATLVSVLAGAQATLTADERGRFSAGCLTEACRATMKER